MYGNKLYLYLRINQAVALIRNLVVAALTWYGLMKLQRAYTWLLQAHAMTELEALHKKTIWQKSDFAIRMIS